MYKNEFNYLREERYHCKAKCLMKMKEHYKQQLICKKFANKLARKVIQEVMKINQGNELV